MTDAERAHTADELAEAIVTEACNRYPGELARAILVLEQSLYLGGEPGLRTCRVCGDIDQPEYRHFTKEHVYPQPDRPSSAGRQHRTGTGRYLEEGERVMGHRLSQEYVNEMLTEGDQERLRTGKAKGIGFGNHSDVIVWEGDHFEEISAAAYQERVREEGA